MLAVHFFIVPTVIGNHDRQDTLPDGFHISWQEKLAQGLLGADGVSLVHAVLRSAIPDVMLGRTKDEVALGQARLKSADRGAAEPRDQAWVLSKTLVGAPPTFVPGDCDTWRKGPMHARAGHFFRGNPGRLLDQAGVMRRAQPDVVGKHHRAVDVVVPVNSINSINEGNPKSGFQRPVLVFRTRLEPASRRDIRRIGISATEH